MNNQERIAQLEAMLAEERQEVSRVLGILENYLRSMDMIARMAYAETPLGSTEEKNATAMKQLTGDTMGWLGLKAEELRGLMGRAMPPEETANQHWCKLQESESPELPEADIQHAVTIH